MLYRNAENDDYRAILKFEKKFLKRIFLPFFQRFIHLKICAQIRI